MSNADSNKHEQFDLFSDEFEADSVAEVTPSDVAKDPLAKAVCSAEHALGGYYLSVKQVAAYFGVSTSTIWRWEKLDFPSPLRLYDGTTRWARVDLQQFEASRRALIKK